MPRFFIFATIFYDYSKINKGKLSIAAKLSTNKKTDRQKKRKSLQYKKTIPEHSRTTFEVKTVIVKDMPINIY